MRSPFYIVFVENTNITNFVTSLAFEDCVEQDDLLKLSLKNVPDEFIREIKEGQKITFQFGYHQGEVSPLHLAYIQKINPTFGNQGTNLTIEALDKGQFLKRSEQQRVWENKTASEIIKDIARSHGLDDSKIEKTSDVYPSYQQGLRSDMEVIQDLLRQAKDGNFRTYVKNNLLVFETWDLDQDAQFELIRSNNGQGNLISFQPKNNANHDNVKAAGGISTSQVSLQQPNFKGKDINFNSLASKQAQGKFQANGTNKPQESKSMTFFNAETLEPIKAKISPSGNKSSTPPPVKNIVMPGSLDGDQATNRQNFQNKKANAKNVTASFKIEGKPTLVANKGTLNVRGVDDKYNGKWYIVKITHNLQSGGGYTTSGELSKNALGTPANAGQASRSQSTYKQVNSKRTQSNSPQKKQKIATYDAETLKRIN